VILLVLLAACGGAGKPVAATKSDVVVSGPGAPPISQLRDLAGQEAYYHQNTIPYDSLSRISVQYVGNIYKYYLAYKMVTEKDARRLAARQGSANRTSK
jgi:hypothetical protein